MAGGNSQRDCSSIGHFAAVEITEFPHRCRVGSQPIGNDGLSPAMPLQCLLQKSQSRRFIPFFSHARLQDLALVINGSLQIMSLAIDVHEHLVKVPAPMTKTPHAVYTTPADLSRKQWPEPVPPKAYRLMANVDAAFR